MDCRTCKQRFRADHLAELACGRKPSKHPGETDECDLTEARDFNLMFETTIGPVKESGATAYLRPETAQGIFINFKNVLQFSRKKPPFGIAQVGKSFRNEITPGNFIFRTREFEQMEMEFFVPPERGAAAGSSTGSQSASAGTWSSASGPTTCACARTTPDELSHYSSGTSDVEYLFPIGWSELEGIANRGDFDLTRHAEYSGEKLEYFDQATGERYVPHVIEPAAGADRAMLAFLVDAYDEEFVEREGDRRGRERGPSCACTRASRRSRRRCCRSSARTASPSWPARSIAAVRERVQAEYDDGGAIGRRYRRQDEIGTPFCLTIDHQSLAGPHRDAARPRLARAGARADRRASREEIERRVRRRGGRQSC